MKKELLERYSRQIIIKDIGALGQKKISSSKILIIGAGGLGCPVADLLSRAGVGEIGIVDNDKVTLSNLHRQTIYNYKDINKYKVNVLKDKIKKINSNVKIKVFKVRITENNAKNIIKKYDFIIDGSDNFKTKFLINKICLKLKKKLIVGAISKFQGHIFTFNFKNSRAPCLQCFYQSIPSDEILNCEADGVIGPIATLIGSIKSSEILKMILQIGKNVFGKIFIFDLLTLESRSIKFDKKKNCVCKKYF